MVTALATSCRAVMALGSVALQHSFKYGLSKGPCNVYITLSFWFFVCFMSKSSEFEKYHLNCIKSVDLIDFSGSSHPF